MRVKNSEGGFTLIESLISIVILMVGLFAISQVFLMAMNSNVIANRTTAAAAVAAQQLDRLKAIPYNDLRMQPGGGDASLAADVDGYWSDTDVDGVGRVHTRWRIVMIDTNLRYIQVRSQVTGVMATLSRADLTTFRSCTAQVVGCP